jgi:hypothetical protein
MMYRFSLLFFVLFALSVPARSAEEFRRSIALSWEPISDATSYEVVITKSGSKEPQNYIAINPEWRGGLPLGRYSFKVRGRDARKVPGEWSEASDFAVTLENVKGPSPTAGAKIQSSDTDHTSIDLKWSTLPGAKSYAWEVRNEKNEIVKSGKTEDTSVSVQLDVAANYHWSVRGIALEGFDSPGDTISEFTVIGARLDQPSLIKPDTPYVRSVKWEPAKLASQYEYIYYRWDSSQKKWVTQEHRTIDRPEASFSQEFKGGRYRIQVRALAPLRKSSTAAEVKFDAALGDRSPAAEEHAMVMESIDHTTGYFAVLSYLITGISYTGNNSDHISDTTLSPTANFQSAIGGTGRVGLGYLSPKSTWGFLGIADYGGISIANTVVNFGSLEANAVRRNLLGSSGELRQMLGLFYKEYPNIIPNSDGSFNKGVVSTLGPHYGIEYWYALNRKLGFQVNGHGYLNALTGSTPNGNPVTTSLSYQLGFLASYRLGEAMTGLMGYAFRTDAVSYKSSNGPTDTISMTGNYLNLVLEWAL